MNIEGADLVNDLSILTSMPAISSDNEINCFSEFDSDSQLIRC